MACYFSQLVGEIGDYCAKSTLSVMNQAYQGTADTSSLLCLGRLESGDCMLIRHSRTKYLQSTLTLHNSLCRLIFLFSVAVFSTGFLYECTWRIACAHAAPQSSTRKNKKPSERTCKAFTAYTSLRGMRSWHYYVMRKNMQLASIRRRSTRQVWLGNASDL